jgi:hypothetical protein
MTTQDVPQGQGGAAYIWNNRPVETMAARMDQMANTRALNKARADAQAKLKEDRHKEFLDKLAMKSDETGFYSPAVSEWTDAWRGNYITIQDTQKAANAIALLNSRIAQAKSADKVAFNQYNKDIADPEINRDAYHNVFTRNLSDQTTSENASNAPYDPTKVVNKTYDDLSIYNLPMVGSRLIKKVVGTKQFQLSGPNGTGYTVKYDDIGDENGNLDVIKTEEIVRSDARGKKLFEGLVAIKTQGGMAEPAAKEATLKQFFPSFDFIKKVDNTPTKATAGGKGAAPKIVVAGTQQKSIRNYNYVPGGQYYHDQNDFGYTDETVNTLPLSVVAKSAAPFKVQGSITLSDIGNEPFERSETTKVKKYKKNSKGETVENGTEDKVTKKYTLSSGLRKEDNVTELANIQAMVRPVANRDLTIGNVSFRKDQQIPTSLLGKLTSADVRIEEGFAVTPQMLQEIARTTEGKNAQGNYQSTTTEEAVKTPLKAGKEGFMGRNALPNIAASYDTAAPGKLDEFYATEKMNLQKMLRAANKTASGNRFNKKPAAAAKPSKPAPKSDL